MSKYVNELIEDIKTNPTSWRDFKGCGIQKDNIIIYNYGNSKYLSVICVSINSEDMPTSYIDLWRLEVTIKNWYRNISLNTLLNKS